MDLIGTVVIGTPVESDVTASRLEVMRSGEAIERISFSPQALSVEFSATEGQEVQLRIVDTDRSGNETVDPPWRTETAPDKTAPFPRSIESLTWSNPAAA